MGDAGGHQSESDCCNSKRTENTSPGWVQRYWAKVDREERESDCWMWQGRPNSEGYGRMYVEGRLEYAHRLAYRDEHGELPEATVIRHRCDNPLCVNPAHLDAGTHADNMNDMATRGRHGRSKLTRRDVREIRERYQAPDRPTQQALADEYGVSRSSIANIVTGRYWKHV